MLDRISTTAIRRTDVSTQYPSPTPAQVDSPVGVTGPRVPISITLPEASKDSSADPTLPLSVRADIEELKEKLIAAGESIEDAFSLKASAALCGRAADWVAARGLDEVDCVSAQTLVARQAALAVLLRAVIFDAQTDEMLTRETAENAFRAAAAAGESVAWCVLDDIAWLADAAELEPVLAARHKLTVSTAPSADLGELYAAIMPSDARQVLSQFRTPQWVGRAIQTWAAGNGDTMLDMGIGPGALSTPIQSTWHQFDEPREVIGVDRSPLAALLGETALTLTNQAHTTVVTDVRELTREKLPGEPDVVVCNPPYAGHSRIPEPEKTQWNQLAEQQTGYDISKFSPLYAYVMFHAETLLPDGGRAAFLTPESFFGTEYGTAVKRFLNERADIKSFIRLDPDGASVFPAADTTAVITVVEFDSTPDKESATQFITVTDPTFTAVRAVMDSTGSDDRDWGRTNTVPQSSLDPNRNWQAQFDPVEVDTDHLLELSDLGTAWSIPPVGEDDPFHVIDADVAAYEISRQHLTRFVRRPSDVLGYVVRDRDQGVTRDGDGDGWIVDPVPSIEIPDTPDAFVKQYDAGTLTGSDAGNEHSGLFRYLRDRIRDGDLQGTETQSDDRCWYRRTGHNPAPILVNNATQNKHRFTVNDAAARTANSFYGVELAVTGAARKAVLAYLNSTVMRDISREYGYMRSGTLWKISLTKLEQLPVIDPAALPDATVHDLAAAFDTLRDTDRDSNSHDEIITTIDTLVHHAIEEMRPD